MTEQRYLDPILDGLPYRDSGSWARDKLDYLERYISLFETAMRNKWPKRSFIDLFAGPGKCQDRDNEEVFLGSPLIALTTKYPFTSYWFVDNDQQYIDVLKTRCSHFDDQIDQIEINFIHGDCNTTVGKIVEQLSPSSLNLAFLDPEGLELKWSTVETLAKVKRMDLIINFSQSGLKRVMPNECDKTSETIIDEFFGCRKWRNIYQDYIRREEQFLTFKLLDLYKSRLYSLGYKEVRRYDSIGNEPLISSNRNLPLYRMLFASKHPLGNDFWSKITKRELGGQTSFLNQIQDCE